MRPRQLASAASGALSLLSLVAHRPLKAERAAPHAVTVASQPSRVIEPTPQSRPGDSLAVYLLTIGQGDEVWERFGHNAIGIRNASDHSDIVYNWGLFDFAQPGFIPHFVRGEMVYWMGASDAAADIVGYIARNRSVTIQELNLTPVQRLALLEFIQWNLQNENRYYHYDYFRDNCSTRVRDALDRVLGGAIRRATAADTTRQSYRDQALRLMAEEPLVATGMDVGLGRPADPRISAWEEMFIPMRMRDRLRGVQVPDEAGRPVPLVTAERQVYEAKRVAEPLLPPNRAPLFLVVSTILAALVLFVSSGRVPERATYSAARSLVTIWCLGTGVLGVLLAFLWLGTRHVFAYQNLNLLEYNPLWLAVAALVPFVRRGGGAARAAIGIAAVAAGLTIVAMLIACIPAIRQDNLAVLMFAAPTNLAAAVAVRRALRGPHSESTTPA